MIRFIAALALAGAATAFGADPAAPRTNIFNLASGAVLVSYTSEYGSWAALYVLDGSLASGWSSAAGQTKDNAFVIELPQRHRLSAIALDNTRNQESGYPGISARHVEISVSTTAPDKGFSKAAAIEMPKNGRIEVPMKNAEAQWVRVLVKDNWGHPQYTELMEIEGYGEPVGSAPARAPIQGVYRTNYGALALDQSGAAIVGCYYGGQGRVNGATDGRVVSFEWTQNQGARKGAAVMVLTAKGDFLNGLWYENGVQQGLWFGKRDPKANAACAQPASQVGSQLDQGGRAILYGIHFAIDSSHITPESDAVLQQVAAHLKSHPQVRLRIEGHTDSTNSDDYNLKLSRERAQAVVDWLEKHGADAARLRAEGFGRARPVADNATPQGRALNRRVEAAVAN